MNSDNEKEVLFISHIHEDAAYAIAIKNIFLKHYRGAFDIFVSSDLGSIKLGEKWNDAIMKAIEKAKCVLLICNSLSTIRPWINFEAGFAAANHISTIPLCIKNMKVSDLQSPISQFQGMEVENLDSFNSLNIRISDIFELQYVELSDKDIEDFITISESTHDYDVFIDDYSSIQAILTASLNALKQSITLGLCPLDEIHKFECLDLNLKNAKYLLNPTLRISRLNQKAYKNNI